MATTQTDPEADLLPPIAVLGREESRAEFDALAREHVGMTREEFSRRLDARAFSQIIDDPFNHPWVGYLAQLSPVAR